MIMYLTLHIIATLLLKVEAIAMPQNNTIDKEIASMMKHIETLELRLNKTEELLIQQSETFELRLNNTAELLAQAVAKIALLQV